MRGASPKVNLARCWMYGGDVASCVGCMVVTWHRVGCMVVTWHRVLDVWW